MRIQTEVFLIGNVIPSFAVKPTVVILTDFIIRCIVLCNNLAIPLLDLMREASRNL